MKYRLVGTALLVVAWLCTDAHAALTDIASAPMASASSTVVKPNFMFVLDDSGSMAWDYLPDAAGDFQNGSYYWYGSGYVNGNEYGAYSNHCNALYYNPAISYIPPVDSTGTSYPNASFTSAWLNGYNTSAGTTDLTGYFYLTYSGSQPDVGFTYSSNGSTKTNTTFYKECSSQFGNSPGKNVFTKVAVSNSSGPGGTDERTNFANWYSYYRTRIQMMKTAVGRAFKDVNSTYRVGFDTISYTGTSSTDGRYLDIADFTQSQKDTWYSKLYAITPGGGTPLRAALSKVGRLYSGKVGTDPVQYSCQQNFTILSTDGYWNGSSPGYKMDGSTAVGNQDTTDAAGNQIKRPMYDALGKSDTLADIAMYYYQTDLRTPDSNNCTGALGAGFDVCENDVPGAGNDVNSQQHMTTFTLGLGVNGTLNYTTDYLTASSGDFYDITQGTKVWPAPVADTPTTVDDLWHTAVNGRGAYFSAKSPDAVVSGLQNTLAGVSARTGSAAAAATSNLEPVAGDNYVYIALYRTVKWDGDLQAKTIDPNTGAISADPVWSAQAQLDGKVSTTSDTRTIYTYDSTSSSKLKPFTWTNLTTNEQAYFNGMCGSPIRLSQCPNLTSTEQAAASGANLVNFIRGQSGFESRPSNTTPLYRYREHVLGDMIDSQPVYVKAPPFDYSDQNYNTFRDTTESARTARVYVADNDGMLHAFNGDTGAEEWAYIPPVVMPNLYKLADTNYSGNHQYYVDGSPTIGDICPNAPASTCTGSQWKTILVGGLNAGGRGYYALDVTDPANPKALWNFTSNDDADLGYTYGNPIITKRHDGTWVVVFTSGYNNVSPGDGAGYLYVLNANTGALLEKISTNTGTVDNPSGLAKINAWVESATDNTAQRFYGGDLMGNVWRFDIDDVVPPAGKEAFLLAQVGQVNGAGTQPITTKPELTEVSYGSANYAAVSVATGRYLGLSDLADTSQQSIYTIKDSLTATGLGQVRLPGVLVQQTLTNVTNASGQQTRTTSTNSVDWATKSGWYVDLNPGNSSPGERVNVDMQQQNGTLTVAANVPNANACTVGGYAWLYYFDFKTGQYLQTADAQMVGERLTTNALVAGIKTIKLTTGKTATIITDTAGNITSDGNGGSGAVTATVKRVSWRELID